jgi:hypothetical protein
MNLPTYFEPKVVRPGYGSNQLIYEADPGRAPC